MGIEVKAGLKGFYSNKNKSILSLSLSDGTKKSANCYILATPSSLRIYSSGLLSFTLIDEVNYADIINLHEKIKGLNSQEILFETDKRNFVIKDIKEGKISNFVKYLEENSGLKSINLTHEKRKDKKLSHPARLALLEDENFSEEDVISEIVGNNAYLLLTDDRLFLSRAGAASGSILSSGRKTIKKYPLDTIKGLDVRKASITCEIEIISSGSIEISNVTAGFMARATKESIIMFPLDEYSLVSNFADTVMNQRKIFLSPVQTSVPSQNISESIPNQIRKLANLRDDGILTEEEFQIKKTDLLSKM